MDRMMDEVRETMHRRKMEKKARGRQMYIPSPEHVFANISVNHPDFGMTPAEHAKAKAARTAH